MSFQELGAFLTGDETSDDIPPRPAVRTMKKTETPDNLHPSEMRRQRMNHPALSFLIATLLSFAACKGSQIDDSFLGGIALSSQQSQIAISNSTVSVGSSVTVQLSTKDQNGNLFYVSGSNPSVVFATSGGTSAGTFSSVTDNGNGTYTTTFTGTSAGTATTINATIGGIAVASTRPSVTVSSVYQSFVLNIPFSTGTDSSYTISDSTRLSLVGGVARLSSADQSDSSANTLTSGGFLNGTISGVQWDSSSGVVRLNTTTNNAALDSSWTPQWSNLVAYWSLDTDFSAKVGSALTASGAGATITSSTFKIGTGSASFDGTASASGATASTYAFNNTTFTVLLWAKTTSTTSSWLVSNGGGGNGWGININSSSAGYIVPMYKNAAGSWIQRAAQTKTNDGAWHHIAVIFTTDSTTETNNLQQIYVDGTLSQGAMVYPGNGAYNSPGSSQAIALGARNLPTATDYFTGSLDDVAICKTALTTTQIQTIYTRQLAKYSGLLTSRVLDADSAQSWTTLSATTSLPFGKEMPGTSGSETSTSYSAIGGSLMTGLVGLWHLDEASTVTGAASIIDSSGTGNNGTPTSTITFGNLGVLGTAPTGAGGYVSVPNSTLNFPGTAPFSVSIWFNTTKTGAGNYMDFFNARASNGGGGQGWIAYLSAASGTISFRRVVNTVEAGPVTTTAYNDGKWHHLAGTYDGTQSIMWIDGKYINTVADVRSTTSVATSFSIMDSTSQGSVDEAAVWSRALTAPEVLELYRRGANRLKYQVRS